MLLTPEGRRREKVTLSDVARAAGVFCQLFAADRVALGADQLPLQHPREPESEFDDQELYRKLEEMLKRHPISAVQ
jgi:microsomal dipeptidase-like Zn-dependent dipeptidase